MQFLRNMTKQYCVNQIINLLMKTSLILTAIIVLAACDQLVPIQKNGYGFTIGDPNGKLQIEAFFDFQCGDSKNSYNALRTVMRTVDFKAKGIKFTYQMIPLQFHYYAYKLHQAFTYVQNNADESTTQKLIDYLFDHQDQFTEELLLDYTLDNFLNQIAALISSVTRVNEQALRAALDSQTPSDTATRAHWKYSVGTHGASGAPIFNANGARIDGAEDWGFDQWIEFLKKYTN